MEFCKLKPVALILPCHVQDLYSTAFERILETLSTCSYLRRIIVGLDGATEEDCANARQHLRHMPTGTLLLWQDGPRMQRLLEQLRKLGFYTGAPGKGRNFWLCAGAVLADHSIRVLACHDCDILTYNRELLARVLYPVVHPRLGFDFCKGYSARFTRRLHGRMMRLLFTPLLRAMEAVVGYHDFLRYLDSFRYPLAGEVAMTADFARRCFTAPDWGVEVGMLAEAGRLLTPDSICQVEFSDRYDHKHQPLLPDDCSNGLAKAALDVAKCVFYRAAGEGIRFDQSVFDAILTSYQRRVLETIRFFEGCSEINGLEYDRHEEETAASAFARSIRLAARAYLEEPWNPPWLPDWNSVALSLPEIHDLLLQIAEPVGESDQAK